MELPCHSRERYTAGANDFTVITQLGNFVCSLVSANGLKLVQLFRMALPASATPTGTPGRFLSRPSFSASLS